MINKNLYVHIGIHKTGTSAIQKSMEDYSGIFNELGYDGLSRSSEEMKAIHTCLLPWKYGKEKDDLDLKSVKNQILNNPGPKGQDLA